MRIDNGGCRECSCDGYDYDFGNTIEEGGKAGVLKGVLNVVTTPLQVFKDNRCKCSHLDSRHGRR